MNTKIMTAVALAFGLALGGCVTDGEGGGPVAGGPQYAAGPGYGQNVARAGAYDYSRVQRGGVIQADPSQVGPNKGTYRCNAATQQPANPGNALCVNR